MAFCRMLTDCAKKKVEKSFELSVKDPHTVFSSIHRRRNWQGFSQSQTDCCPLRCPSSGCCPVGGGQVSLSPQFFLSMLS